MYTCTHIYIYRERERDIHLYIIIYVYVLIKHTHMHTIGGPPPFGAPRARAPPQAHAIMMMMIIT